MDINGAYDEDAGAAEIYMSAEMAVGPIISMSTELMDRFRKWICSLHTNTDDRPLSDIIKDGKVLNFNYTEFVEDLYGMDAGNICYIHGCRKKTGKERQRLILGHIPGANDEAYDLRTIIPELMTWMSMDSYYMMCSRSLCRWPLKPMMR